LQISFIVFVRSAIYECAAEPTIGGALMVAFTAVNDGVDARSAAPRV
jgi:hypothetical protein